MLTKLIALLLLIIPLYPKFPIIGVSGTFVSVRLEDFLIAVVFLVFLLRKPTFSNRPILLYLFIGLVSTFSAITMTKSVSLNQGLLHFFRRVEYMSLFFVGYSFLSSLSQIPFLVRSFLITALLVALYGLGQQFLGFPVITTTNSEFSKGLTLTLGPGARINSTFAGHYDLAAYTVFPLLLILGLLSLSSTRFKPALLFLGLLVYWSLLLSASRVTFAAFYLVAFAFVWLIGKKVWIPLLLILALFSVLVSPQLAGRYRQLLFPSAHAQVPVDEQTADALVPVAEDRSFNIRLKAEWPRAMRAFLKNPVLGTGYSSVGLAVDNDYLRALAETGILGLLAFILIIFRFLKTTPPFQPSLESIFVYSVTLSLVSLLLNALFIDVFEASKIALLTWLTLGLAEKVKMLVKHET